MALKITKVAIDMHPGIRTAKTLSQPLLKEVYKDQEKLLDKYLGIYVKEGGRELTASTEEEVDAVKQALKDLFLDE